MKLLYDNKRISIQPSKQIEIVSFALSLLKQKDNHPNTMEQTPLNEYSTQDLTLLGTMLAENEQGKPVAFFLLSVAEARGDLNAEFKKGHLISLGSLLLHLNIIDIRVYFILGFVGHPRDLEKSIGMLEQLAEKKHALSMYILGLRCIKLNEIGRGISLIRGAAENRHPLANAQLGMTFWLS